MSKGIEAGEALRTRLGLTGAVDAEVVAETLGLKVLYWQFRGRIDEVKMWQFIVMSNYLPYRQRNWAIAHGIGHHVLHAGNQAWLRVHTLLAVKDERQAEDFAYGLLVDEEEAMVERLADWEWSEYFRVPDELLWR
jgi:Zn-dependent peptidase ImmA (M78 family)